MVTVEDAIGHIESLYPPDSGYEDTAAIGRNLMDCSVGNKVGYDNWRDLSDADLFALAKANLEEEREYELAFEFCFSPGTGGQPSEHAHLSS